MNKSMNKKATGGGCSVRNNKITGGDKTKKNTMKGGSSKKTMTKKSKKSKKPMKANEAYCMVCKSRVVVHDTKDIKKKTKNREMIMREGLCPKGHKTYRIVGN